MKALLRRVLHDGDGECRYGSDPIPDFIPAPPGHSIQMNRAWVGACGEEPTCVYCHACRGWLVLWPGEEVRDGDECRASRGLRLSGEVSR